MKDVARIQNSYRTYHSQVFGDSAALGLPGNFLHEEWMTVANDPNSWAKGLCNSTLAMGPVMAFQLMLWALRMMWEYRRYRRLSRYMDIIPMLPLDQSAKTYWQTFRFASLGAVVVDRGQNKGEELKQISRALRYIVHGVCTYPRLISLWCIGIVGIVWMTSTTSPIDTGLRLLVLDFILRVDDMVFMAFFPQRISEAITTTAFGRGPIAFQFTAGKENNDLTRELTHSRKMGLLTLAAVPVYMLVQQVLPWYNWDMTLKCFDFAERAANLLCHSFEEGCFTFGPAAQPALVAQ